MANVLASSKLKLFSNTDLCMVLESRIPHVRLCHNSVREVYRDLVLIDEDILADFDSQLRRRFKAAKKLVHGQLVDFVSATVSGQPYFQMEFDYYEDFMFLYLIFGKRNGDFISIFEEVLTSYEMPYQVVCSRIAGKTVLAEQLQNLHSSYGDFVQTLVRYRAKHEAYTKLITSASECEGVFLEILEAANELMAASTDMADASLLLSEHHRDGMDFVRYASVEVD